MQTTIEELQVLLDSLNESINNARAQGVESIETTINESPLQWLLEYHPDSEVGIWAKAVLKGELC